MKQGSLQHFMVVAAILREAEPEFLYSRKDFILRLFETSRDLGKEANQVLTDALYESAVTGTRGGTPGEPFPEDLRMEAHAKEQIAVLGHGHPATRFYRLLLEHASMGIQRQLREKRLLDAEDEERESAEQ
jgi:hypothetical protein